MVGTRVVGGAIVRSRHLLKGGKTGFDGILEVRCGRRGIKNNTMDFGLSKWKDSVAIN